jgi:hypothetical protein
LLDIHLLLETSHGFGMAAGSQKVWKINRGSIISGTLGACYSHMDYNGMHIIDEKVREINVA